MSFADSLDVLKKGCSNCGNNTRFDSGPVHPTLIKHYPDNVSLWSGGESSKRVVCSLCGAEASQEFVEAFYGFMPSKLYPLEESV